MKSYYLVFNQNQVNRQTVIDLIERIPEITNWQAFFPSAIALVCTEDATHISQRIRDLRETPYQFFIVEKSDNSNGWLSKKTWKFLNNPTGEEDA